MARINRNLKPRKPREYQNFAADVGDIDAEAMAEAHKTDKELHELFGSGTTKVSDDSIETDEPVVKPKLPPGKTASIKPVTSKFEGRRVLSLDDPAPDGKPVKLTKKAAASLSQWHGKNEGKARLGLIQGHIEKARKKFGHRGVYHGSETKDLVVGIPIPSLAFEFAIGQDVFPLGLILQLVAKPGVGKSALLAEFARWFDISGGLVVINENETKFSPEWYESFMGAEAFGRMQLNRCDSIESWQDHLTYDIDGPNSLKKALQGTKEEPGPGRTVPVLLGVDSIMGKMSRKSQDNIRKEGSAGPGHPIEALSISRYMRTVPQWIDGWPFAIVLVNHLKIKKNEETGLDDRQKAGGELINFQESFELELRKTGKKKLESTDYEGFQVDIECAKSSFGPTHRTIRSRVLWWEEPDDKGEYVQRSVWDWDWSTTHLLFSILNGGEKNVRLRQCLKEIEFHMDFKSPTAEKALVWSKTLGVSEKSPLLWNEMGELIRKTPEVQNLLRQALRIKRRPLLKGDYLDQKSSLADEMP